MIACLLLAIVNWQQGVSYDIEAKLNTEEHTLSGVEYLTYYNNSPYQLETLYIHLYANAYRDRNTYYAREAYEMGDDKYIKAKADARGYVDVVEISCGDVLLQFQVDETVMAIPMYQPLDAGDSLVLKIGFYVKIPKEFPNFGYWREHYEMTQWYPKVCVFDEEGWHDGQLHPLGGSFGEFGTYDVTLDIPGNYVVAATGELVDTAEKEFLDTIVAFGTKLPRGERKRVHFRAENVHDFAWVCDPEYGVKRFRNQKTDIYIFYRPRKNNSSEHTNLYAADAIYRYSQWFGQYPYKILSIVDGFHQGDATYPQLIILGVREDRFTRLFESTIATEIARQWFNGAIGPDGVNDAWLGSGFAAYAAIRYMEDKYGIDNSLIKASFLPPLSLRYLNRAYYYFIQTNHLGKPVSTPVYDYVDVPISYHSGTNSKPALFLFALENILSKEVLDEILQEYYRAYTFKHARSEDFIKIYGEMCSKNLVQLFDSFLNTTEFCDWRVNSVGENAVEIENMGDLKIPVDLHITTASGEHVYSVDAENKKYTVVVPDTLGEIKTVALDPSEYTLDPNYWNNYSPRKLSIKPIFDFDWPSFSTYQILWAPYLWYDNYDGVTAGFYLFGDRFADFDFVKGGYQVTAGYTYGFGSRRHYPLLNYQTPVLFKDGLRMRVIFGGSRSRGGDNMSIGFSSNLGRPFTRRPQTGITNMVSYYELSTYSGLDSIDWELGRNVAFDNYFRFRHSKINVDVGLSFAHHALGSEREYLKTTFEIKKSFESFVPFSARLFVGKIFGSAPTQERLFLSGLLRVNRLANLFVSQSGTYSPQERVHIPGGGNMRGYQTLHIKADQMYVLNLEFPTRSLVRVFTDIGYYEEFAFDVGVRFVVGTETFSGLPLYGLSLSLNLPLYSYGDEPWKLRWSIGFSS